jgi:hypothetical protein
MMQSLFTVPIITGKVLNMPDQGFIDRVINAPTLAENTNDGLDSADPKDRKVSKQEVVGLIEEMTQALKDCGESVKYESHWVHVQIRMGIFHLIGVRHVTCRPQSVREKFVL